MFAMISSRHFTINSILIMAIILVGFVVGFHVTFVSLYDRWLKFDEAYGHGLLVVIISVYLAQRALLHLDRLKITPCKPALTLLLITSVLWFIADTAGITLIQQMLLPVALWLFLLVLLGTQVASILLFPIGFLYFAIPFWDYFNDLLIQITVVIVKVWLNITDIPAFVEGNAIQLPWGKVFVADGCSGLRYLISGLALSSLSAYLNFRDTRHQAAIILLGGLLSLLANWVRVFSLILIGFYTKMQSPLMEDHDNFGWVVFFLVFSPIFIISWRFANRFESVPEEPVKVNSAYTLRSRVFLGFAAVAVTMVGPALSSFSARNSDFEYELKFATPMPWVKSSEAVEGWQPKLPEPYQQISASYGLDDEQVNLFISAYKTDAVSHKLLPYIPAIYERGVWHVSNSKFERVKSSDGKIKVNVVELKRTASEGLEAVWYWYNVGGISTPYYSGAKLSQVAAKLLQKDYAMVVVVSRSCASDCSEDHAIIERFLQDADLNAGKMVQVTQFGQPQPM